MSIQVMWDNPEHTIIRYEFDRMWTWDDFYRAKYESDQMMEVVNQPIGIIFNMPPNVSIPENALSHGKNFIDMRHAHLYMIALVGINTFLRTLFTLFQRVYPYAAQNVTLVTTLDEARALLTRERPPV